MGSDVVQISKSLDGLWFREPSCFRMVVQSGTQQSGRSVSRGPIVWPPSSAAYLESWSLLIEQLFCRTPISRDKSLPEFVSQRTCSKCTNKMRLHGCQRRSRMASYKPSCKGAKKHKFRRLHYVFFIYFRNYFPLF